MISFRDFSENHEVAAVFRFSQKRRCSKAEALKAYRGDGFLILIRLNRLKTVRLFRNCKSMGMDNVYFNHWSARYKIYM